MGTLPLTLPHDHLGLPALRQARLDLSAALCVRAVKGRIGDAVTAAGFLFFRPARRIPCNPATEAPSSTGQCNFYTSEHYSKSHSMDKTCSLV